MTSLPIRLLPTVEKWDCHGCGICCRGVIIRLSDEEYQRIRDQHWEEDPRFAGRRLFIRESRFPPRYRLAHRQDGYCVFFNEQRRCSIHEKFGYEAKPLPCRMFPYQLVPLERQAYLTLRRNCPSAALQQGRPLADQEDQWRPMVESPRLRPQPSRAPPLNRRFRGTWRHLLLAADALERLTCDRRMPLVRRLAHGLEFCNLLDVCRVWELSRQKYNQLISLLEGSAAAEAGPLFGERRRPRWPTRLIFRRTLADYLRLHPQYVIEASWRGRFRWARLGWRLATGRGSLPELAPDFPAADWRHLEQPLGRLSPELLQPLDEYFETITQSKRFAVSGRRNWSLVDRYRALAMSFAIATWFLRLAAAEKEVTQDDVVNAVITIERGEGHGPLGSPTYRRRLRALERNRELARLLVWYAQ